MCLSEPRGRTYVLAQAVHATILERSDAFIVQKTLCQEVGTQCLRCHLPQCAPVCLACSTPLPHYRCLVEYLVHAISTWSCPALTRPGCWSCLCRQAPSLAP